MASHPGGESGLEPSPGPDGSEAALKERLTASRERRFGKEWWSTWWYTVITSALVLALALGLVQVAGELFRPIVLLVLAVVFANAVEPAIRRLAHYVPRTVATIAIYAGILIVFAVIGWLTIPRIAEQAVQVVSELPLLVRRARDAIGLWDPTAGNQAVDAVLLRIASLAGELASLPLAIVAMALEIGLVLVLAIYWSIFLPSMRRFLLSLFPARHRAAASEIVAEIGAVMGGFVRAIAIDALIVGILVYVGMLLLGVKFPLLLALVSASAEIIPIVGPFIGAGAALAVALLQSSQLALMVLIFFVILQQFENHVLVPNLVHRQAEIPPPLGIFALLAGAAVGGPIVAITAIPISGGLYVLIHRVVVPAIRHWSGADQDPLPPLKQHPQRR